LVQALITPGGVAIALPPCLLLNSTYEPLQTISWQRAVSLSWAAKVDVVERYSLQVRSPSTALALPAVVRVRRYVHAPRPIVRLSRRNVWFRDHGECQYCGAGGGLAEMTIDHVVPRSRGGGHRWENVALACPRCNRIKGARTPAEAGMPLARAPFRPRWLSTGRIGGDPRAVPTEWEPWLRAA
jgi:5-methylcytosine-specific restriction endonuclease McrA